MEIQNGLDGKKRVIDRNRGESGRFNGDIFVLKLIIPLIPRLVSRGVRAVESKATNILVIAALFIFSERDPLWTNTAVQNN